MNTAQQIQKSPSKAAGFEVEDLDKADEATFNVAVIKDEEGEPVSGFIIVGKNSPEYQAENEAIRIEGIKRASKRSKQIDTSTDAGAALVAQTVSSNEKRLALAVTVGWFGFNSEGAPLAFNKQMVEKMYAKKPTWLAEVSNALEADGNFTKV